MLGNNRANSPQYLLQLPLNAPRAKTITAHAFPGRYTALITGPLARLFTMDEWTSVSEGVSSPNSS